MRICTALLDAYLVDDNRLLNYSPDITESKMTAVPMFCLDEETPFYIITKFLVPANLVCDNPVTFTPQETVFHSVLNDTSQCVTAHVEYFFEITLRCAGDRGIDPFLFYHDSESQSINPVTVSRDKS